MIRLEHITKTFQTKETNLHAVKDVSLTIDQGAIFGIIGFSGAGKSTLVRCINLLEVPSKGKVWIRDTNLLELSEEQLRKERQKIGMIFQHFNLLAQRTVLEIVGKKKAQAVEKARELLKLVGLEDKETSYPAQLSGGQKQRVAIARALATDPDILLCDEATSALDPITTSNILSLLKEINEKLGLTIVIITHQMEVVKQICHKVAIMEEGKVVERGNVSDVFTTPKSEVAKKLLLTEGGKE